MFTEKQIQTLLKSVKEKERQANEKVKATYQRMFWSESTKNSNKETNGYGGSDPILIKNTNSVTNKDSNSVNEQVNGSNSTPKLIQVASINDEAPC